MRYVTWLIRWYQWSHRPLPLVLLIACGACCPAAASEDSSDQERAAEQAKRDDATSAPAPVLRLTRQQPDLDMPGPADKPTVRASSRRTLQAEPKVATRTLAAPQAADSVDKQTAVAEVAEDSRRQRAATTVSSDGWIARGSSVKTGSSTGNGGSAKVGGPAKMGEAGPAASNTQSNTQRIAANPFGLQAPQIAAPDNAAAKSAAPRAVGGSARRTDPPSLASPASMSLKPVPRLAPPAVGGKTVAAPPTSLAAPLTDPVVVVTPTLPRRILPADRQLPAELNPPAESPAPETVLETDSPIGSGLAGSDLGSRQTPRASSAPRRAVETPVELPVRRPQIESPREERVRQDLQDPQDRGRVLQEQIEQFERETSRRRDPASEEAYENPSIELETDEVEESFRESPREPAAAPAAPLISAAASRLERPIAQCLQYYYNRPENARERTPWGMLHAIIPYGLDAMIDTGRARYSAIAWLAGNNPNRNLRMFTTTRSGQLVARSGVGLQGHQAQTLAIFAQVGVPQDYPIMVNKRKFTVMDLVRSEMAACKTGEELTFTLIGLSHYLPTDTRWQTADGEVWDFERLIREELSQPVVGAACGGTHRLMGFTYALKQRRLEGLPTTGEWLRAEVFIDDFIDYAWSLQNRDGSFSTDWFEGRADNNDLDRKLQTSGHIMEWLLFASTAEQLNDERVIRGVTFLANAMIQNRRHEWQVGPKGHAIRALSLYHRLVFDSRQPWKSEVAQGVDRPTTNSGRRR